MHAGIALRRGGGIKGTRLFMRTIKEFNRKIGGDGLALTPLGYPARLLGADETYESVTDKIGGIVLEHPRRRTWWAAFLPAFPGERNRFDHLLYRLIHWSALPPLARGSSGVGCGSPRGLKFLRARAASRALVRQA